MSDTVPAPAPGGQPRWLKPLLVASLALNLLVIGVLIADHFRPEKRGRSSSSSFSQIIPPSFFWSLPDERRKHFREIFSHNRAEFRSDRRALRDAASAFADSLTREPFDAAETKKAIEEYGSRSHRLIDLGMEVAGEVAEALTPEERTTLAERVRARAEKRRGSRKKKD